MVKSERFAPMQVQQVQKIVVLHGLYMPGLVMRPLCRRLRKLGYQTLNLTYNSLSPDLNAICARIDRFIDNTPTALVGHSMGGLIARRYLESGSEQSRWVDPVITLGTPHRGSYLARRVYASNLRWMLHDSAQYLLPDYRHWPFKAHLYSIAGDLPMGVLSLLNPRSPSDGTVLVDETRIPGMSEHKLFHLTHLGLIYSHRVVEYLVDILRRPASVAATG